MSAVIELGKLAICALRRAILTHALPDPVHASCGSSAPRWSRGPNPDW